MIKPGYPRRTRFNLTSVGSLALLWVGILSPTATGDTTSGVRAEIEALLARLESSNCDFERNGRTHSAAEAKAHLLRKLDRLQSKRTITNTEQFIDLAASKSSLSGEPYLVMCPSAPPIPSAAWLRIELEKLRGSNTLEPKPR